MLPPPPLAPSPCLAAPVAHDDAGHGFGPDRRWSAGLDLIFEARLARSVLTRMSFHGPLRVQRPFYPEGPLPGAPLAAAALAEPCHCCLLHPPGGLVSGDDLRITALVEPQAHVLLTTPSAAKCYAADACQVPQAQHVALRVRGGLLEWLPRETIVYDGARAELTTAIDLDATACCLGWEALCLGRAAAGERFTRGRLRQRLSLWRAGRPLLHETLDLTAGDDLQHGPFGLQGETVCATLFAVGRAEAQGGPGPDQAALEAVCAQLQEGLAPESPCTPLISGGRPGPGPVRALSPASGRAGATLRQGVLLLRYLGPDMEAARRLFFQVWALLRPVLAGRAPCPPRVWAGAF